MTVSSFPSSAERSSDTEASAKAKETADILDHQYDGIQEYDNPLPRWWVLIFWASFVFSLGYFFHYHVSRNGVSVEAAYAEELRKARQVEAKRSLGESVSAESLRKLSLDAASMSEAKTLFAGRCAPCHGARGEGLIGPNLTDAAWLHGNGEPMALYSVIEGGVPEKGMPAWGKQLSPVELRKVAAFVGNLTAEHVPGKAPEGVVHD